LSCTQEESCKYSGNNKDYKVFNDLRLLILRKDTKLIYEYADSSVVNFIFIITDSLKKPNQFGLIKECRYGIKFNQLTSSSFVLCVGKSDPIISYSGGCYKFKKREHNGKYVLSEVVKLE
jgi:hypothetical protein